MMNSFIVEWALKSCHLVTWHITLYELSFFFFDYGQNIYNQQMCTAMSLVISIQIVTHKLMF